MQFFGLEGLAAGQKTLQLNPKFGLTAPAPAPYFGDGQPLDSA
jgi:hypothetical protein